jgi:broad specificity phosphatase PhoE
LKLIIVRHGETDRNRFGLHMGHAEVSLNDTGRQQAEYIAGRLASEPINTIYSSDLLRAKETARAISRRHPEAQLVLDPELRERNSGVFSTQPISEHEAARRASGQHYRDWKPPRGESLREVKNRAGRWYAQHRQKDANKTILVVSHGLFIYTLLEWAIEDGADVERSLLRHHNAAITILEVPGVGAAHIIQLNDTTHLK